jgi:hypothetical protein
VRAWEAAPGVGDSAEVGVTVTDVQEPPSLQDTEISINEVVEGESTPTTRWPISASDPDGTAVTYSIVSDNPSNAFGIDASSGELFINNATMINYEKRKVFHLGV